jgi:hypothetical protein
MALRIVLSQIEKRFLKLVDLLPHSIFVFLVQRQLSHLHVEGFRMEVSKHKELLLQLFDVKRLHLIQHLLHRLET